jgi:hypothetical protein
MIKFSQTVQDILAQPVIEAFYLVEVVLSPTNSYKTSTYFRELTIYNGVTPVATYLGDGKIVRIDTPKLSSTVDRELFKISFADPNFTFGATIDSGLIGKIVDVKLGFVNQTTKQVETDISNIITIYRGAIDSTDYSINTAETGEVLLNIGCSSPMNDLDMTKPFYTTKDASASRDSSDTAFDQIYEGSGVLQLKWGKV